MPTDNAKTDAWNELLGELISSQGAALVSDVSDEPVDPPVRVRVFGPGETAKAGAIGVTIEVPSIRGRVLGRGKTLTLVVARGAYRYEGACQIVDRGSVPLSGGQPLRTLVLRGPGVVESVQRRAWYRLNTTLIIDEPAWLTPLPGDGGDPRFANELIEAEVIDVSGGGAKLRVRTTPELRRRIAGCERYAMRLTLPDRDTPAVGDARVTHVGEPRDGWTDLGMEFVGDYGAQAPIGDRVEAFVEWAERCKILEQREQDWLRAQHAKAG
ncbi:MAG: PilZ domain-containing protein [Planctomycetota bacterium]